jgi:UDP-glucose 4-epimerase
MSSPGLRIAVTGAAGFLGAALVRRLAREPRVAQVVALDLRAGEPLEKVRWVVEDVRSPKLAGALAGADAVAHLAFVVFGDLREAQETNVSGSANVFETAGRSGCKRVLFVSSVAAYGTGHPERLLREEDPLRPVKGFVYSETKAAAERSFDEAGARYPAAGWVKLRPCIVIGPGAHRSLRHFARTDVHVKPGGDTGRIQLVHVDDVVEGCVLALLGEATGSFNLAAEGLLTVEELAALAGARVVTVPGLVLRGALRVFAKAVPGLDAGWLEIIRRPPLISADRAREVLGWKPTRTTAQVAAELMTYDWSGERAAERRP